MSAVAEEVALFPLASGLDQPTSVTHAGDNRLFITLQRGRIMVFDGTRVLPQAFLDISGLVSCCGERGLLSVAFHPSYRVNGQFFVNYTNTAGDTVVARYTTSASDPNRADPASAATLLTIAQPYSNHNGGQLQFGPDGYLYIGMGDGGSGGDPQNRAQDLSVLLGKLLRIDVSSTPYRIPESNPFVPRSSARNEIWAYGLRNPWRFSFDRATGDLWIADVGQSAWEEVNLQRATSIGGENYGWRKMEGKHCYNPSSNCTDSTQTLPIIEYSHSEGCSVTGGYRYRGSRSPRLQGTYFYGDYCSGTIWGASEVGADSWKVTVMAQTSMQIMSFGEDLNGELYVVTGNGGLYAISDPHPTPPRRRAVR